MAYSDAVKEKALHLLKKTDNDYEYVSGVIGCCKRTLRRWNKNYTLKSIKETPREWNLPSRSRWGFRYIYMVRESFLGLVKIGVATDLNARMWAMQTGCPQQLDCVGFALVEDAASREKEIQHKFLGQRYRGEWFKLSDSDIENIRERFHEWHINSTAKQNRQSQLFAWQQIDMTIKQPQSN